MQCKTNNDPTIDSWHQRSAMARINESKGFGVPEDIKPSQVLLSKNRVKRKKCSEDVPKGRFQRRIRIRQAEPNARNSIPRGYKNRYTSFSILAPYHVGSFKVKHSCQFAHLSGKPEGANHGVSHNLVSAWGSSFLREKTGQSQIIGALYDSNWRLEAITSGS